ncbi:MAG TPA: hypothetical protein VGE96_01665 [Steroidobacteraceae bacterium]
MWKVIRISVLLLALAVVLASTWLDRLRTTSWKETLWVGVFPMNGDGSVVAERYIASLTTEDFASLEQFFANEAGRYGLAIQRPVRIELYPSPKEKPPLLAPGSGVVATAWWSLKIRWFAHRAADVPGRAPSHIRVFVLYHDPDVTDRVPHSLGLQKGLVGVVHAFADREMNGQNSIVIAHETMHTVGATDKYDLESGDPQYPDGFAEPDRDPRYPQDKAEIMAGQRAISPREHEMPSGLRDVVVGPATAHEIGWTRK